MDEKLLNRIISVAYGDASFFEKIKIYILANKNADVKTILDNYKKVANVAHNLNTKDCPSEVVKNSKEIVGSVKESKNSLTYDLYSFIFGKPIFSAAILGVFLLAMISTFIIKRPEIHQQYSKQELEIADKQIKHSLALISGVFHKTKSTVENDILTDRVSKPIKESFNIVNDYLQGDNNENIN